MKYILLFLFIAFVPCCASSVPNSIFTREQSKSPEASPSTRSVMLSFFGTFGERSALSSPWGMSFALDGTLYVCDRDNSQVVRFDRDGRVMSVFSGFDSRTGALFLPVDVSVSGSIEVYVLESANSRVVRFDRNLKNAYTIYEDKSEKGRRFGALSGLVFDAVSGDIFISDRDNGTIIRMDMLGGNIQTSGNFGSEKKSLSEPIGIDISGNGALVIADKGSGSLAVQSHFGTEIIPIGKDLLQAPVDVAVLPDSLIAAADRKSIKIFRFDGRLEASCDSYGEDLPMSPRSVAYSDGKLYVGDGRSGSILIFTLTRR